MFCLLTTPQKDFKIETHFYTFYGTFGKIQSAEQIVAVKLIKNQLKIKICNTDTVIHSTG